MVIVSHDMGVHYQVTDRMAIMYSGSIIELGNTEKFSALRFTVYHDARRVPAACRR